MQNRAIAGEKITASSMWDENHHPGRARLFNRPEGKLSSSWSAKTNDLKQWIQAELNDLSKVTRIATQGRQEYDQWVKSYALQYSIDGTSFTTYDEGQVFRGNSDRNTVVENYISPVIIAKFVRILPRTWHNHISMRFELYGCTSDGMNIDEASF